MKNLLTHSRNLVVPALLGCAACALAQSLGNPVADVWIGRPLEVTVPARIPVGEGGRGCVQAQVAYGDTRLSPDQVRTTVLGNDEQRRVRVQASVPIDEPIVTLTVRAGCTNTVTRSYTLLPDMPADGAMATATPIPVMAPLASPARVPALTGTPLRTLRAARGLAPHPRAHQAPLAAAPRLVEVSAGELRTLLHTTDTLSQPGDPARSATARLLWQAINADPHDLMRSTANLQRLERELVQLRATAGQTRTEMAMLRRSLADAQPWYASASTIQVLSLLIFAAAAATAVLAWRAYRQRNEPAWFDAPAPQAAAPQVLWDPAFEGVDVQELDAPRPVLERRAQEPIAVPAMPHPVAPQPVAAMPRPPVAHVEPPARELPPMEFDLGAPAAQPRRPSSGVLRVETLAATFEEVEFLASLGLEDDAMDVLKAYLEDSSSPAPIAYFELMRLCAEDDAATVEAVRRRYAQVFGVEAPRVQQVAAPLGLETHKALSERISRAWGTQQAVEAIERALFEPMPPGAALTLQAGRDLLSLHDLAMALASASVQEPESHPLAPWANAEDTLEASLAAQAAAEAVGGHRFALDVDLGAAPEPLPASVEQPDREQIAARLKAEKEAARQAFARKVAEEEDAFSAAVASERVPVSRY